MTNSLYFGSHTTSFGNCLIAWHEQAIYWLSFFNDHPDIKELQATFPAAKLVENNRQAMSIIDTLFSQTNHAYLVHMQGTPFQKAVWLALLDIKPGTTKTYQDIANLVGNPKAVRAVASAIGQNNISYLIPCHRVIRKDGSLGGYRWALERKQKMLTAEKNT